MQQFIVKISNLISIDKIFCTGCSKLLGKIDDDDDDNDDGDDAGDTKHDDHGRGGWQDRYLCRQREITIRGPNTISHTTSEMYRMLK